MPRIDTIQPTDAFQQVKPGTKIVAYNMTMVVTHEDEQRFFGYHLYKGRNVGECSIEKSMFSNPHYQNQIKIEN